MVAGASVEMLSRGDAADGAMLEPPELASRCRTRLTVPSVPGDGRDVAVT